MIGAQSDAKIVDNIVLLTIVQRIGIFQNEGWLFSLGHDDGVRPKEWE